MDIHSYTIPDNDQDPNNNPESVLGYDTAGRLGTVASNDITHTHGYIPGTGTLSNLTTREDAATNPVLTRTLYHDRMGRLFGIVTANAAGAHLSRHGYTLDKAGRRTRATRENGQRWDYGYDDVGQVTSGVKKFPNGDPIPGHSFSYGYDGIGNRTTATHGGANTAVTYTPNALNQYDPIETEGGRFILGEAPPAAPVIINGDTQNPAARPGGLGFYWKQITADNSSGPLWSTDTVTSNGVTITGQAWTPAASVAPEYDFDGNLTNDGRWDYNWDAEQRLIRMTTTPAAAAAGVPRQRLDFVHDSQGRRVSKTVSTSPDGNTWTIASNRRFLYDGWNPIAEYSAPSPTSTTLTHEASYLWGLDLSGTMQGAGGVGGLLAVHIHDSQFSIYYPAYDGNGNISAWIGPTGALLARMDYSPFGQLVAHHKFTTDARLARLPFGFSTKYTDAETGLLYYGHRYYDPVHGRWSSRDPIEEEGGVNLYGFLGNGPLGRVDILGHEDHVEDEEYKVFNKDGSSYLGTTDYYHSFDVDSCQFNIVFKLKINLKLPPGFHAMLDKDNKSLAREKEKLLRERLDKVKKEMVDAVSKKWDNKFKFCCHCDCPDGVVIRVKLAFVDSGGQSIGLYDFPKEKSPNSTQAAWNVDQGAGRVAGHEIGHFLGNIDEYGHPSSIRDRNNIPRGGASVGRDYGEPEQGNGNIMNNPNGEATISHFWHLNKVFSESHSSPRLIGQWCKIIPVTGTCPQLPNR